MKRSLLPLLACPECRGSLVLADAKEAAGASPSAGGEAEVEQGSLVCEACGGRSPIVRGLPRFIESDGYVANFSFEWTRFATTQLDSARGWRESEERFQRSWPIPLEALRGKRVLDAGCGMGRFAEIAAKHGATVIGADLSFAVEPAARNLALWPKAHIIQADLRRLPFKEGSFDFIYSLGVLHHTPNPRAAFNGLLPFLKPGGMISVTLYTNANRIYVISTTLWRLLTKRMPTRLVYFLSHLAIPFYYLYRIPVLGLIGKGMWPISMHPDPEWRVLDTFDCYTPKYQFFFSREEVRRWFQEAGLEAVTTLDLAVSIVGRRSASDATGQKVPALVGEQFLQEG